MKVLEVELVGTSTLGFGRKGESEKKEAGETEDTFALRTYREKCHVTEDGEVFLNPIGLKKAVETACSRIGESVPGKGKSQWTKFVRSGISCNEPILLGVNVKDVSYAKVYVPSNGMVGGGKRVWRYFPTLAKWSGKARIEIIDESIPVDKMKEWLAYAGQYCGVGVFRPSSQSGGWWGRFKVKSIKEVKI